MQKINLQIVLLRFSIKTHRRHSRNLQLISPLHSRLCPILTRNYGYLPDIFRKGARPDYEKEILKQEREQFFNAVIWRNLSFSAYLGSNLFIKTQQKFNCPKSIIKTPEKVVKRFWVNNKNTRTTSMTSLWCFHVNFEHISPIFLVSIVDFEQVTNCWET